MEPDRYDIFIQIIQNGSLTKTAQKTGYSQSGISHMVAALEAELGVSLLHRNRAGVSLTPEGEALLPYIHSITKSRSNLKECVNQLHGLKSGTVRISTLQSISTQVLPGAIASFHRLYPGVRFELITGGHSTNIRNVVNGVTDFCFTCIQEDSSGPELSGCEIIPFTKEKMVVTIPYGHPLAGEPCFPVEALRDERSILIVDGDSETRPIFSRHHINPDILFYMGDAYSIMAMVEKGVGISIIPEMSVYRNPYRIHAKELSMPAHRNISILYRKQPLLSNAARAFIDAVRSPSEGCFYSRG